MNDLDWMREAYQQALIAQNHDEVPVGAVLVHDKKVIGRGFNHMVGCSDATAHAEIMAIREGGRALQNYRLENSTLYVTLEPCAMCAGAIIHSRIMRVVFATRDFSTGAAGSMCNLFGKNLSNHWVQIDEGIMQKPCETLIRDFFKRKRTPLS